MVYSRKNRHLVGTPFHPLAILPLSDIPSCTINSVSEVFRENALQDSKSRKGSLLSTPSFQPITAELSKFNTLQWPL